MANFDLTVVTVSLKGLLLSLCLLPEPNPLMLETVFCLPSVQQYHAFFHSGNWLPALSQLLHFFLYS